MRHFVSQPKASNVFIVYNINEEYFSVDDVPSDFLKAFSKALEVKLSDIQAVVADPDKYSQVLAPKEMEVIFDLYTFVQTEGRRLNAADSFGTFGTSVFTYSNVNTGACVSLIFCKL